MLPCPTTRAGDRSRCHQGQRVMSAGRSRAREGWVSGSGSRGCLRPCRRPSPRAGLRLLRCRLTGSRAALGRQSALALQQSPGRRLCGRREHREGLEAPRWTSALGKEPSLSFSPASSTASQAPLSGPGMRWLPGAGSQPVGAAGDRTAFSPMSSAPEASAPLPCPLPKPRSRPHLFFLQLPHPQWYLRWLLEELQM